MNFDSRYLTIMVVNYNSFAFFNMFLKSISITTGSKYEVYACDNGSSSRELKRFSELKRSNVHLFYRQQSVFGSKGHGEALDFLSKYLVTKYAVVFDVDCIPVMKGWDKALLSKLIGNIKVAGAPLAFNTPKTDKYKDFPLTFMTMFDVETFKSLGISFKPMGCNDTGWELRNKYLSAGYKAYNLLGVNTRDNKLLDERPFDKPFGMAICDEYYFDKRLISGHFGRGSNSISGKYSKGNKVKRVFERYLHYRDKVEFLSNCKRLLQDA